MKVRAFVRGFIAGSVIGVSIVILVELGWLVSDVNLICQHLALRGCH